MTDIAKIKSIMDEVEQRQNLMGNIIITLIESLSCIAAGNRALNPQVEARMTLKQVRNDMAEYKDST